MKSKKNSYKKKKNRNRTPEIRITSYFFLLLFFSMIVYLCIYVKNNEQTLLNNSYNSRQNMLAQENYRGSILDKNGEILAQTVSVSSKSEQRQYPYDNLFSHVVGFSTKGKTGMENC